MSRKSLRVPDYLDHILVAIERIDRYTRELAYDDFVRSDVVQDAVIRNFEVIGEASRNIARIDPNFVAKYPDSR
jgi:uncharacterized protein with HEPN domain